MAHDRHDRRVPRPAARHRAVPQPPDVDTTAEVGRATPNQWRQRRRALAIVVVVVGALLAVGIPAFGGYVLLVRPQVDVPAGRPVQVEIPEGADTRAIADKLAGAGVVDNAAMFRLRARIQGVDGKLKPGVYDLVTGASYGSAIDALLAGPPITYSTVTIPEGFTIQQIAERLEEQAGIPASEFDERARTHAEDFSPGRPFLSEISNHSLEGYLFPKTYRIPEGASADDVIDMMLDQFAEEMKSVDLTYARSRGLTSHDVVIIASMIEREARLREEQPLISSVIYNRLEKNMKLEIDATIEYIIPGTRPRLLDKHLRIDSPYNTYMYGGLPIGPISNPGIDALRAAAAPAQTRYLYYVLTGEDGSHTFTETHEEFLKAKEKSRKVVP
ncbi:MAG: endolytic transglycosylase MltG [Coriobacteriales bacterium]|nr:endolytic transglycosylase MltG [Actinomycetes bacterium]